MRYTRCDNCRAVVGSGDMMLASAGYVTQLRKATPPYFMCKTNGGGLGRSRCEVVHEHPIACSDDCERELLAKAGHFFAAQHVGIEDATVDDRARILEEEAFLAYYGNTEAARIRLLNLRHAQYPIAPVRPIGLPVCP